MKTLKYVPNIECGDYIKIINFKDKTLLYDNNGDSLIFEPIPYNENYYLELYNNIINYQMDSVMCGSLISGLEGYINRIYEYDDLYRMLSYNLLVNINSIELIDDAAYKYDFTKVYFTKLNSISDFIETVRKVSTYEPDALELLYKMYKNSVQCIQYGFNEYSINLFLDEVYNHFK